MKRCLPLLLLLLLKITIASAQINTFQLSLQSGIAIPVFDFSSTNLEKGSFALPGFTGSAEINWIHNNLWGVSISSGIQLNPIAVGILGYEKVKADPFLEDLYIRSDPFKVVHIMAGPSYTSRISKSFSLMAQLKGGVFLSYTPYQLYKPDYFQTGPPYYEITTSKDLSFAYGAGVHLNYEISPCYSVGIGTEIMSSKAAFQFKSGQSVRTDNKSISLWNNNLTLTINL